MKNFELERMYQQLKVLEEVKTPLPIKVLAARMKNMRILEPYHADFEKLRNELIQKYGTFNEDTQQYEIKQNSAEFEKFVADFNELASIEQADADAGLQYITLDDISGVDGLPVKDFDALSVLIKE